ncbi:MAG: GNAT family N-acetyltransferase [Actinomycetota bacterium]
MPISIRRATAARVPVLATLLGRAFVDDPMMRWPLPRGDDASYAAAFLHLDRPVAETGWLWEAEGGTGVAVLVPPGEDERYTAMDDASRLGELCDDGGARYVAMWDWVYAHHPPEPFWMIDQLAVDERERGRGIGSALVRHGQDLATRDGVVAVLETAVPHNVGFYERLGFRPTGDGDVPGGGPHIWFLRFDPA